MNNTTKHRGLRTMLAVCLLPAAAELATAQQSTPPAPPPQATAPVQKGDAPIDRFMTHLGEPGAASLPPDAVKLIREAWANCNGCDGEELLTQGLTLISEKFREGLDAYDAEKHDTCIAAMDTLLAGDDPFLAVAAAGYRVKSLAAAQRTGDALKAIEGLLADGGARVAKHSYFLPELDFLKAYCLVSELKFEEGEKALVDFLRKHPDAPQRLTLSARQMLGELTNRAPGGIAEVTDLMGFSGRRLDAGDSGGEVQEKQERIVSLLDTLIEQAEQQEQNSSNSQGDGGSNRSGKQPQQPMQESRLVPGSPEEGRLNAARRAQPGEMWGAMPPAQRERILQAMKESFPSRYRQLVEQYYEELAKKP